MKIKRYEPGVSFGDNLCGTMEEDSEGEWVRLDDVMALLRDIDTRAAGLAKGKNSCLRIGYWLGTGDTIQEFKWATGQ